jgi:CHASE2 domain-containing sensor protein
MTNTPADSKLQQDLSRLWESKLLLYVAGLCLTLAVAVLSVFQPAFLQKTELLLYDLMVAGRAAPPQSPVPVLVGIDEESLAAFGQWPWPRYRLAMLVEHLQRLGAKVIALDFVMPEPDRSSPEVIQAERRRDLTGAVGSAPPGDQDSNSRRLAAALARGQTVLGYYLDFSHASAPGRQQRPPAPPAGMVLTRSAHSTDLWPRPKGQIRSLPLLTDAASAEGFTNALEDVDGTLRRVPLLLLSPEGKGLPSLALASLLLASPQRALRLVKDKAETFLRWDSRVIPLDSAGNMLLDFRSGQHPYFSARTILEGEAAPGSLQGKIVLVGGWASGLGDWHTTPSGESVNGLEVHATIIDDILAGTFIARPEWARGVELFAVLVAGAICTLLLSRSGFMLSLFTVIAGTTGLYWGARQLLVAHGVYLSPLLPMLTLVIIAGFLSLLKHGLEARKLRIRTQDLLEAQDEIIVSLSVLAEARDKETGGHIRRTQRYVEILARQLATTPKYAHLTESDIELLAKSAPLHDIGKVGISDSILQKPGKLTEAESKAMQSHTLIGAEALTKIVVGTGHPEKQHFLNYARQMTESHHERWDGNGYPHGLRGEGIPLAGRLMALADVYDALISERVYKKGMAHADVRDFIAQQSGTQFDPDIVAAFMARDADFFRVAREFADVAA